MGSADGLAKFPYIRECRRIKALRTIVEQDVSADFQPGPVAAHFADSIGVGWYPIDIHRAGPEDVGISCRTRPFQIPLGALIPIRIRNLIAAAKNIGTTHITNGCYPSASRGVEHWGGCRSPRSLLPHRGEDSGRDMPGQAP